MRANWQPIGSSVYGTNAGYWLVSDGDGTYGVVLKIGAGAFIGANDRHALIVPDGTIDSARRQGEAFLCAWQAWEVNQRHVSALRHAGYGVVTGAAWPFEKCNLTIERISYGS